MAYTYEYFYTVQVETMFMSLAETNSPNDKTLQTLFGEYIMTHREHRPYIPNMSYTPGSENIFGIDTVPDIYGIYTLPASAAGPYATQIRATKDTRFRYTIRVYLMKTNTSVNPNTKTFYWLNESCVKNLKIIPTSTTLRVGDVKIDKNQTYGSSGFISQETSPSAGTDNQSVNFMFTLQTTTYNKATLEPPFTVTADIFPDKVAYKPTPESVRMQVDLESDAYSGALTLAGINPKLLIREGRDVPTIPPEFRTRLYARTGKYTTALTSKVDVNYVYDICNKQWIGYKSGVQSGTSSDLVFSYLTSSVDGKTITETQVQTGKVVDNKTPFNLKLMAKKLYDAQLGQCGDKLDDNPSNAPEKPVQVFPPTDAQRWNPPPHIASKGIPFGIRAGIALDAKGQPFNPDEFSQLNGKYKFIGDDGRLERGRIFQDKLSAEVMNHSALSLGTGSKATAKQWGFRFMYNPEVIGYSTSGNNSIDWTFGSKDSATSLGGNQTVKVELLISRISDLSYLNMPAAKRDEIAGYGRPLQDEERYGLLNRGTEYDLEFLYRCLNGDPEENTMLLDENYGVNIGHKEYRRSSDIGYITGIPLWMYLGANLRYYGSVTGINVTHKIFDLNMVPMLSVVAIDFTRYPAAFNVEGDLGVKAIGTLGGVDPASTPTTPTPGG